MKKKTLALIFTFIAFFLNSSSTVSAAANFKTDYQVTYDVQENGTTKATINGTLTNTSSDFYASSYKMQVGFDEIANVKISDPDGPIKPVITKTNEGHVIEMQFNKKAVGLNSKLQFTLTFDTPAVAKDYGKVWEITIPGLSNPDDFQSFVVTVIVPPSLGKPKYIKPVQPSNSLTFTKQQLGKSGISIAFGEKQMYGFHLVYHLRNGGPLPSKTYITLPPTTNYQDVFITNMSPLPNNVTTDTDGNWIAEYSLLPSQKLDVIVQGKAGVRLTPLQQELTQAELAEYIKPKKYWEADDNTIKGLANQLQTPEAIYHYVITTLNYDFSRVTEDKPRLGAVGALNNQDSAACREFTDLFIALARAAGIPAREVDGFAHTENSKQKPVSLVKDILHAWPEYYDSEKKTWVMVDPTWGSTTGGIDYFKVLDYDHLAFAIKGHDSSSPVPAGGYKVAGTENVKDVNISFVHDLPEASQDIEITKSLPETAIAGLPIKGEVTITNNGSSVIPAQAMYVSSKTLTPSDQMYMVDSIPPFGHTTVEVKFDRSSLLTNSEEQFTIRLGSDQAVLGDKTISQSVKVAPFFLTAQGLGGIALGILTIIILITASKVGRLRLFR